MGVSRKILIVDDEKSVRDLFSKAFSRKNYQVVTAKSGPEALDILNRNTIYVNFLDLNMPEMNGIELCKTILKKNPLAIVFAVTGYISLFELSDCKEAGFEDYFVKPVKLEMLFSATERAFNKLDRWKKKN